MVNRLLTMQRLLRELQTLIEADVPEAQRLMEQGKDWEWHKVTARLEKVVELESLVRGALVIEVGEPAFGMAEGPIGGIHDAEKSN